MTDADYSDIEFDLNDILHVVAVPHAMAESEDRWKGADDFSKAVARCVAYIIDKSIANGALVETTLTLQEIYAAENPDSLMALLELMGNGEAVSLKNSLYTLVTAPILSPVTGDPYRPVFFVLALDDEISIISVSINKEGSATFFPVILIDRKQQVGNVCQWALAPDEVTERDKTILPASAFAVLAYVEGLVNETHDLSKVTGWGGSPPVSCEADQKGCEA